MQISEQNRLYPEKGPGRISDSLLSLILALCGTLFVQNQELFQSDVLYIPAFIEDLFRGISPGGWSFSPAPYVFPDMLAYFLFFAVSGLHQIALRIYGIVQAGLILFLLLRLFSPPGKRQGWFRLFFSAQFVSLMAFQDFYAFLFLPGMHCSAFLMTLALFHRIRKETLLPWRGIYIVLLSLSLLADPILLVYAHLPILLSLLFARKLRKRNPDYGKRVPSERIKYWLKVIIPSSLIGLVLYGLFRAFFRIGRPGRISPLDSVERLAADFGDGFGIPWLFYAQCVGILIFSLFLLQRVLLATEKEIRKQDEPSLVFYGRISSSNLLGFIWIPPLFAVLFGNYVDPYSIRYFAGSFIVSNAGLLSILCNVAHRPTARVSRFTGPLPVLLRKWGALAAASVLLPILIWKHRQTAGPESPVVWKTYYPNYVQCLDSLDVDLVMADYWHAKSIYLFSHRPIVAYHADYATGKPSRTIANENWWKATRKGSSDGGPRVSDSREWNGRPDAVYMQSLSPDVIRTALGAPDTIKECPGADLAPVWIYKEPSP